MSIRTDNGGFSGPAAPETSRPSEPSRATGPDRSATRPGAGDGDQVRISQLAEAIAAAQTERTTMVERLAADYRSGGYQVDSASVARALVRNALEAGGTESDR